MTHPGNGSLLGSPFPLGATWTGEGTNVAVFSEHATAIELCLFDGPGGAETQRVPLAQSTAHIWHAFLPDVRPGACYGFRAYGPYEPHNGHRFNPNKLLLDPYAKALSSPLGWSDELYGYTVGGPDADLSLDERASAPVIPKSVVVNPAFDWGDDRSPGVPWSRTVIYECHVKGMTARHPAVPEDQRGKFLGLGAEPILEHLTSLGVTAVELLPVHHFVDERALVERGLTNYWGYNSIGFFAPEVRYASGGTGQQVTEFKTMVKRLHAAGLEVILDVVYNHTAEGNALGPTLSFRGLDNAVYYRLQPGNLRHYADVTGCGNTLNLAHPTVLRLVLDSLRYWVTEMHVDGFRFDLAPALGRYPQAFDPAAPFFQAIRQDPVLSQVKLIAEPWDIGPNGYQLGAFPVGWSEWNGKYRDTVRRFWRGEGSRIGRLASRLSGSSDVIWPVVRGPTASINFVTCHDGFTLRDLVMYDHKHNEANGESNRDGTDNNLSRNWGAEGPTDTARISRIRERTMRNLLATLAFAQGVPMLSHGDEVGRSQRGNNNAYCQDNELTWIDWELDDTSRRLLTFTREALTIRRGNPVFRRRTFFHGGPGDSMRARDVVWIRPDGAEMTLDDWHDAHARTLGMLIMADASDARDEQGRPITGETVLLVLHGSGRARPFVLPPLPAPGVWRELLNTNGATSGPVTENTIHLVAHSLILLAFKEQQ